MAVCRQQKDELFGELPGILSFMFLRPKEKAVDFFNRPLIRILLLQFMQAV